MIFTYLKNDVYLKLDIDAVEFVTYNRNKSDLYYNYTIGLNTGRVIELKLDYESWYELDIVLKKILKKRINYNQPNPFFDEKIGIEDVSAAALSACSKLGVKTIGELSKYTRKDLLALNQVGRKTVTELEELLNNYGMSFAKNIEI